MAEKMTRTKAVLTFLNKDTGKPVSNGEFMAFWKECTPDEREEYGRVAAREIGAEISE